MIEIFQQLQTVATEVGETSAATAVADKNVVALAKSSAVEASAATTACGVPGAGAGGNCWKPA